MQLIKFGPVPATPTTILKLLLRVIFVAIAIGVVALGIWLFNLSQSRGARLVEGRGTLLEAVDASRSDAGAGVVNEHATIRSSTGLEVSFRVLRSRNDGRRVPTILLLAGHRTGRDAVDLVGDPGAIAVVAMDYPYHGPEKFKGVWKPIVTLPEIQRALLATPSAALLVLDWLVKQPWVDVEHIELLGGSIGTPFAAVAGASDKRFRRVWLVHGGARNREWLAAKLEKDISSPTLRNAAAGLLHLLAHGASFDTAEWVGKIAPRPVVIIGAQDDENLTPDNIASLYRAAGEPKKLIWTTGGHIRGNNRDALHQILDLVRAGVDEK